MDKLTFFTPTYNRVHTLPRTYESLCRQTCKDFEWLVIDDGSNDGTRKWIESLGKKIALDGCRFDWMGRLVDGSDENHFVIQTPNMRVEYVYKQNGGLYTGYNVAYALIESELCVCIDSDDFVPDDAVEKILTFWREKGSDKYCGILGLDYNVATKAPIGGKFPPTLTEVFVHEMHTRKLHKGDTKQVLRTDLMKSLAPIIGFEGEKNFNPVYLIHQVCDKFPILVLNENLCWVEYQDANSSMSANIFKQYVNSPRSFAKMRLQEMELIHNTLKDRFRSAIHYVSSCCIAKDSNWMKNSTRKALTLLAAPFGFVLYKYVLWRAKK